MNLDNIPRNKKLELYFLFNEMIENAKNDLKKVFQKKNSKYYMKIIISKVKMIIFKLKMQ